MNNAIFLDRDGVIIEEKGFICSLSQSRIFPFAAEAIARMNQAGFKVIVISNQSAIGRGVCTKEQVEQIHEDIRESLLEKEAVIHTFYYSPFHPEAALEEYRKDHPWRKPEPGMILQAAKDFDIHLPGSYMMGDSLIDIQAGQRAGCKTVLLLTGKGGETQKQLDRHGIVPDMTAENILTAIDEILRNG
ncbi:MAG: HAD family hydrolase [bacterium]|nr:HAD family hydrolase [bacterium]